MTGVGEGKQHIIEETETTVVTIRYEMLHRAIDIVLVIEGFHEVFLALLLMRILLVDLFVVGAYILLLNEGRIGEHECTQIARRRGTIDISLEA